MPSINPSIFKAYDIRGIYPTEINPEAAYRIAWAFGKYLKEGDLSAQGGSASGGKKDLPLKVAVGLDMRGSSPFLAREVVRGLNDQGIDVVDLGKVPIPALYSAVTFKDLSGGVMVTASHNPKEYNGLKFCREKAIPVGELSGLQQIKNYAQEEPPGRVAARGGFWSLPDATRLYVEQELSYLNPSQIKKFKIAADAANAMGALHLEEFFSKIACDPIKLNWDLNGNMPVHEPNPLKSETLQQLQAVIQNEKADFGIATDGDGDRIGFLDETGTVIPASIVIGLVAQALLKKYPGSKIGYDLRCSRIAKEMIEAAGGEPVITKVGHSNIKKLMTEENILFAGELSMHYYFRENYNYESPIFVTAQLLLLRSLLDKPFSELWRPFLKYAHSGEINFEVADKEKILDVLENKYKDGKISKLDGLTVEYENWWFNIRPSNTEPLLRLNLEADTQELMKQKVEEISSMIKE